MSVFNKTQSIAWMFTEIRFGRLQKWKKQHTENSMYVHITRSVLVQPAVTQNVSTDGGKGKRGSSNSHFDCVTTGQSDHTAVIRGNSIRSMVLVRRSGFLACGHRDSPTAATSD